MAQPAGGGKPNRANMYGLVSDSQRRQIRIDAQSHAMIVTDYSHNRIHDGKHFYISGYTTGLTDTQIIQFHVITPNTTNLAHMNFNVEGTGVVKIHLYEGASFPAGGTTLTAINNNRNSTIDSILTIIKDGASTSTGTLIDSVFLGSQDVKRNVTGGDVGREDELILKKNTVYLYRMSSLSTGNNINHRGSWYEDIRRD